MTGTAPLYVRVKDIPERFGISRSTFYLITRRGEITIHKRGGVALVKVSDLEAWIEGRANADHV